MWLLRNSDRTLLSDCQVVGDQIRLNVANPCFSVDSKETENHLVKSLTSTEKPTMKEFA